MSQQRELHRQMVAWATQDVRLLYDYLSPSGATEIRLLPNLASGEIAHATTPPHRISTPGMLDGITEFFFILSGWAELWRSADDTVEITTLFPGRCVKIPAGTLVQYRTANEPLEFLVISAPRWERERWRRAAQGHWSFDEFGYGIPSGAAVLPSWTTDVRNQVSYPAPDGSEIRVLLEDAAGGFAHCSLAQGACTQPVKHRTVDEIWFVLGGAGTIWRKSESGETSEDLLRSGRCVTIPVGTSFQFKAEGRSPLRIGIGTFPKWPGSQEAEPVEGPWEGKV
jgi:mannose-6-phosphate isomerase-like protein (cupin superfamily)